MTFAISSSAAGGSGGEDLIARDIQRGRDNGIPDYNTLRDKLGLAGVKSFAQITSNVQVQQQLKAAYGSVNNIDAFEGGLAEDHVAGSEVGPLFQAIMVDQFTRLRDGDRFFYLNQNFNYEEYGLFQQGNSLTKVIEANTNITNLQANAFYFKVSISGKVVSSFGSSDQGFGRGFGRRDGLSGVTINLEDTSGNIIASTTTGDGGQYHFDGLSLGTYRVREVLPTGYAQLSPDPADIKITRGMAVNDVYFVDYNTLTHPDNPGDRRGTLGTNWRDSSLSLQDGNLPPIVNLPSLQ